jgi:excinuclease ABC subunit A
MRNEKGEMENIVVRGARQHNLKNIDVDIPRNSLVVITGISGSGKSSLAFDTLYAEGQRRYVESLSSYARQFLERMDRPEVDSIEGLSPAIAIEQKTASKNPRSTVGTITEIYDYLRVLFARVGQPHCMGCGEKIQAMTIQQMVDRILTLPENTRILILSPLGWRRKNKPVHLFNRLRREGFVRVRIHGIVRNLDEPFERNLDSTASIEVVVDRLMVRPDAVRRITDSIELALRTSEGRARLTILDGDDWDFTDRPICHSCNLKMIEPSPQLFSFNSALGACPDCSGLGVTIEGEGVCSSCKGSRLRPESLAVTIEDTNIYQVSSLDIVGLDEWISKLRFSTQQAPVANRLLNEVRQRLKFLTQVGLSYLSIHRPSTTLAGGEAQRLRLATQIGSQLVGVLYILDEPSIGLHQRDNKRLLKTLKTLKDQGNTVLVVEHDTETIMAADHVIDVGPGAGDNGGNLVFSGKPEHIGEHPDSLTGQYLSGKLSIPVPFTRRTPHRGFITIEGASANNLQNISASIPVGLFSCVSGVSGSGKSSLILDTLYRAAAQSLHRARQYPGAHARIVGLEKIDKVVHIDQGAIGRTPRSNPATYTGVFNQIRNLLAQVPEARARGYRAGRFSFNVRGGRCEACSGQGILKVEMHFLPDVYVTCDQCNGLRFNRDTLEIIYKGKNIWQLLDMTITEALRFFANIPAIKDKLSTLEAVGLGYLKLGQGATTLSGGEAQRIKLSRELSKRSRGRTLYLLDEPTTGLHFDDIKKLLYVLNHLVEKGNTVVVIEHHLDVIKTADFVIDLGPEGGTEGGRIVGTGTPEEIAQISESHTGKYLRQVLDSG